jgi:hypothetical protein
MSLRAWQAQLDSLSAQCDELRKESAQNEERMEIIWLFPTSEYLYVTI